MSHSIRVNTLHRITYSVAERVVEVKGDAEPAASGNDIAKTEVWAPSSSRVQREEGSASSPVAGSPEEWEVAFDTLHANSKREVEVESKEPSSKPLQRSWSEEEDLDEQVPFDPSGFSRAGAAQAASSTHVLRPILAGGSSSTFYPVHPSQATAQRDGGVQHTAGASRAEIERIHAALSYRAQCSTLAQPIGPCYLPAAIPTSLAENKRINALICSVDSRGSIEDIASICRSHWNQLNHVNIATALHRIAKALRSREEDPSRDLIDFIEALADKAKSGIKEFSPQSISNTVWALAILGVRHKPLMEALGHETSSKIAEFKPKELATTVSAFAKLSVCNPQLMEAIATLASSKIEKFNEQDLANTAWAFATLGVLHRELMQLIAEESVRKSTILNDQALSTIAWAFAKLEYLDEPLMAAITSEAGFKIGSFNHKSLSTMAWAFAKFAIFNKRLMDAVAAEAEHQIADFIPKELADTAWAFATLSVFNKPLMDRIAEESIHKIEEFSANNLTSMAWAFAKFDLFNEPLIDAITAEVRRKIADFNPSELTSTAWAFATFRVFNKGLMDLIAEKAIHKIEKFAVHALASIAWSFAVLGVHNPHLMDRIAKQASLKLGECGPRELANISWALAVLECEDIPLLQEIAQALAILPPSAVNEGQMHQFFAVEQSIRLAGSDLSLIPSSWEKTARSRSDLLVSTFQVEVGRYLTPLARDFKLDLREEFYVQELNNYVDFAMGSLAIEVDGPHHFAHKSEWLLGSTLLRNRLLKGFGWKLVSIPYLHWHSLNEREKRPYLKRLLSASIKR